MKTIVTFLIALLAFASTLAWAGPEQVAGAGASTQSQPLAQPGAKPSASTVQHAKPARTLPQRAAATATQPNAVGSTSPASNYGFDLPAGPAVICACVVDKTLG